MSLEKPAGSHTENTFRISRIRNHNFRMNLNGNKLANVQRDIMNKKRFTEFELIDKGKGYRWCEGYRFWKCKY